MSLGLLSRAPAQVSTSGSTEPPSSDIRETRRPFCSQKTMEPSGPKVWPLAALVCSRSTWTERSGASR